MSPRATRQLAQLWQLPLLLLSLVLFAVAGYLFINASPGLTVRKRIDIARQYIAQERPEAALEQLNRLLAGERMTQEHEAAVHLHIAEALESAQRQRKISIAINHTRIIEQTQLALQMGTQPTGDIHRRVGDSYQALGRPADAVGQFRQAMALDPERGLRLRRKIIEVQSSQEDGTQGGAGAMTSLEDYLNNKTLTDAERAWALGEKSQILADRGEFVAARALIADSLRLDSDPVAQAQANYRMAYCAWKLSKNEEAERLLRLARDQFRGQHPLDADAAYLLGRIRQQAGDLAQALTFFQVVLTKFPESRFALNARVGRGVCRVQTGQEQAGLVELRELVDMLKTSPANLPVRSEAVAALAQTSQLLAGKSNYQGSLDALELERVLSSEPAATFFGRVAAAAEKRAEQLAQMTADGSPAEQVRRSELAREMLIKAADAQLASSRKLATTDGEAYAEAFTAALDLYERAQNAPAAIAAMELLVAERSSDPIVPDVMLRLGQALTSSGSPDRAIPVYQRLVTDHPTSPAAARSGLLVARAFVAKGVSGYLDAEKTLLKLVREGEPGALKPDSVEFCEASLELAKLHYRTERFDDCVTRLTDLIARFPSSDHQAEMHFLSADSTRRSAMKVEAQVATATVTVNGSLTKAVQSKKERFTQARQTFDRVIELYRAARPADDAARQYEKLSYFYRADCEFELGSYGEAIRLYNEAAARYEREPACLAAYVQIVNCYCAMGKMDDARTANEKAKQLLRRMPAEAFNDGGFVMPKAYWEQWLKWTSTAGAW